jgi:monoamine oxidase
VGRRILPEHDKAISWPLALTAEGRRLGLAGMRQKYVQPALAELWSAVEDGTLGALEASYDARSFADVLTAQGASRAAIELLNLCNSDLIGEGAAEYSALDMIGQAYNVLAQTERRVRGFYTIAGGNDRLPQALAAKLAERVQLNTEIVRVDQDPSRVRVTYCQGPVQCSREVDCLVLAVPPSILRKLETKPAFSSAKARAIREVRMTSVSRIYFETLTRFWRDQGLSGFATTDLPLSYFWQSTAAQGGDQGILQGWLMGPHARHFDQLAEEERQRFALEQAEKVFLGLEAEIDHIATVWWDSNRWSGGAYPWFKPGQ